MTTSPDTDWLDELNRTLADAPETWPAMVTEHDGINLAKAFYDAWRPHGARLLAMVTPISDPELAELGRLREAAPEEVSARDRNDYEFVPLFARLFYDEAHAAVPKLSARITALLATCASPDDAVAAVERLREEWTGLCAGAESERLRNFIAAAGEILIAIRTLPSTKPSPSDLIRRLDHLLHDMCDEGSEDDRWHVEQAHALIHAAAGHLAPEPEIREAAKREAKALAEAIEALRERRDAKPVAWQISVKEYPEATMDTTSFARVADGYRDRGYLVRPLYAAPPKPEPTPRSVIQSSGSDWPDASSRDLQLPCHHGVYGICDICDAVPRSAAWPTEEDVERTRDSESVLGYPVAAYRETHPEHGTKYGYKYSSHWSTPNNRHPDVTVERLFTESQLRAALSAIAPPQASTVPTDIHDLEDVCEVGQAVIDDGREWGKKARAGEVWEAMAEHYNRSYAPPAREAGR